MPVILLEEYIPLPAACRPFVGLTDVVLCFLPLPEPSQGYGMWHAVHWCRHGVPADIAAALLLFGGMRSLVRLPAQIKRIKRRGCLVPHHRAAHPLVRCVSLLF